MQTFALPRWAYVPGTGTEVDRAPLERVKAQVPSRFDEYVPAAHPALVYGLGLNDEGFFWEAHEILEAVWKAARPGGLDRICLRGCIQIANANLKLKMGKLRAAERLIAEAMDEFAELAVRHGGNNEGSFAGCFPAAALLQTLRARVVQPSGMGPIMLGGQRKT